MPDHEPILAEFAYLPRRLRAVLLFLLASAGTALLTYCALTADGVGRLNAQQARLIFGGFAALSPIGLIALGLGVCQAFVQGPRVAITRDAVLMPQPTPWRFSEPEVEIPLASITKIEERPFLGQARFVAVGGPAGQAIAFSNHFRSREDYDSFVRLLLAATGEL